MPVPFVCSIDSLIAAAAMALTGCPEIYWRRAVTGFIAFDTIAGIAGSSFGITVTGAALIPAVAAAAFAFGHARRYPVLYLFVPMLLSIDNLVAGAAEKSVSLWSVGIDGIASGVLAWAGFTLAKWMMRLLACRRSMASV
jgi:hypothetical protein